MICLLKLLGLKLYFHSPSGFGQVVFLTLELIVKAKTRKLILYLNLLKVFIFQHGLNFKLSFLKSKAQVMQLICYTKENINMRLKKVLAPIIDTIITLGRLFYLSVVIVMTQSIIQRQESTQLVGLVTL